MPIIYLSPSTQEWNPTVIGQNEEYYMNLIADAMIPYLTASGIAYTRNTKDMTAASSIAASNRGSYDLHLALHSNAAPDALSGQLQGPDVYHAPGSVLGARAAHIIAKNLKTIYPDPNLVHVRSSAAIAEVQRTKAPSVLIEFAYHDNVADATWIQNNIQAIARNVAKDLGDIALPLLPVGLQPFTVAEFFPTPGLSEYYDPRQHAIALCYMVPIAGDCKPQDETLDVEWVDPKSDVMNTFVAQMVNGHGRIVRQALAWAGI